jgi:DNA-directed RNA polymerase subunit RPC12/RpoP
MTTNTQVCRKCFIDKPLEAFHGDRRTANRKRTTCILCRQGQRSITNISRTHYSILLVAQNYKCAICGIDASKLSRELSVDHSHITQKVRGLLCNHCNIGLGNFKDSSELLTKAIDYLGDYGVA